MVSVDLFIQKHTIRLINIYAPNAVNEQVEFIEKLYNLQIKNSQNVIIVGDFNCSFGPCNIRNGKINQREWYKFFNMYDMREVRSGSATDFTWSNGIYHSYIDKFFCRFPDNVFECVFHDNYKHAISDHNLILTKIKQAYEIYRFAKLQS